MSVTRVQVDLLSDHDKERVQDALKQFESEDALPEPVREPVLRLLRLIADGHNATILGEKDVLTSTEAAAVLGVSRPFLNKILDQGAIPYHLVGRDRRLDAADVVAYREARDDAKLRQTKAAQTYHQRRTERLASMAGVALEDAQQLGFA